MKFIKNNKKIIAAFAAGIIMAGSVATYGTYTYLASNVTYTKEGTNVNTVAEALNDLYSKTTELTTLKESIDLTDVTASDITSGKKAYTKDGLITGNNIVSGTALASSAGVLEVTTNFRPKHICLFLKQTTSTPGMILRATESNNIITSETYATNSSSSTPYYFDMSSYVQFNSNGFSVSGLNGANNIFASRTYNWFATK